MTLVYQQELPNLPGKSIKGLLVEYGPPLSKNPAPPQKPRPESVVEANEEMETPVSWRNR